MEYIMYVFSLIGCVFCIEWIMTPRDKKDRLYGIFSIVGCIVTLILCIFVAMPLKISIPLFFISIAAIVLSCILFPQKIEKANEKDWKQKEEFWKKEYEKTNQQPELANYGRSADNPIWAGTAKFYFNHLCTEDEMCVTWKFSEEIELEKRDGLTYYKGFYCKLAKYDIFVDCKYVESLYVCTSSGLDGMRIWHAPKGYKFR